MSSRVYILLDVVEGKAERAAKTLRDGTGVKLADVLEERPRVIAMIQARTRSELAKLTNRALVSVESMTESLEVLPTLDGLDTEAERRTDASAR